MASTGLVPPGMVPTDAGHDRGPSLVVISWTFSALSLIFILLRAYVRIIMLKTIGFSDIFLFVAMACTITNSSLITIAVRAGLGRHIFELNLKELETTVMYLTFSETVFALSLVFSKMSICLILLHLLHGTSGHKKRYFLYFTIGLLVLVSLANIGVQYGLCHPISKSWNPAVPGHCWDLHLQVGNIRSNGVMAALTDFSLAAFPITFIKDLKMRLRQKIMLCSLMSIGVLAGICAIIRTITDTNILANDDITHNAVNANIWGVIEENVSIIVACIPILRPLFTSRNPPHRIPEPRPPNSANNRAPSAFYNGAFPAWTENHGHDVDVDVDVDIDIELRSRGSLDEGVGRGGSGGEWKEREGW